MHFIIKTFLTQDVLECTHFFKVKFDNKKSYKIRAGKHFRNLKVFKFRVDAGIKEGIVQKEIEMIKNLKDKLSTQEIAEVSKLSIERVKEILNDNK